MAGQIDQAKRESTICNGIGSSDKLNMKTSPIECVKISPLESQKAETESISSMQQQQEAIEYKMTSSLLPDMCDEIIRLRSDEEKEETSSRSDRIPASVNDTEVRKILPKHYQFLRTDNIGNQRRLLLLPT